MSKYLEYVSQLAINNIEAGGGPFGACIVYRGEIIAEGVNETHLVNDITRHAELIAIEKAQKHLDTMDLSECVMYASAHPCAMCLGAIGFSNIKEVYYSNTLEEAQAVGLGLSLNIYNFIKGHEEALDLKFEHVESDLNPMKSYQEKHKV
ncbi:MAG: nucleoside deaminase [Erysipelothrix sp.]|nr:nucleoside deaminase [Erysipelothrix sp.]